MNFEVGKIFLDGSKNLVEIICNEIKGSSLCIVGKVTNPDGTQIIRRYFKDGTTRDGDKADSLVSEYKKPRVVYLNLEDMGDGSLSCYLTKGPVPKGMLPASSLTACIRVEFTDGQFDS